MAKTDLQRRREKSGIFTASPNYPMPSARQPAKIPTSFEQKVYSAVSQIPRGFVSTYSAIAALCGSSSARAVGQALRKNPFAPEVPCHRVVRSDGSLGGFFGRSSSDALDQKRRLLENEGIDFDTRGRVQPRFLRRTP
jgi:methylated-DNA-[protein]-cysteine S-methyltransferase